jgi:hypothetical protein
LAIFPVTSAAGYLKNRKERAGIGTLRRGGGGSASFYSEG